MLVGILEIKKKRKEGREGQTGREFSRQRELTQARASMSITETLRRPAWQEAENEGVEGVDRVCGGRKELDHAGSSLHGLLPGQLFFC